MFPHAPKKQKDGRYRSKLKIGVDQNGDDILKYVSGRTKAELEAEKEKVISYYIEGSIGERDTLFGSYAADWYAAYKEPFLAPSSQSGLRTALNRHILPAFGDRQIRAIRSVDLQTFLNQFKGKSKTTLTNLLIVIKGVFDHAVVDGIISVNPTTTLRRPDISPPKEKSAFTKDDTARILAVGNSHRRGLFLLLMYYLGTRPGEALGLQWGDFDFDSAMVHIQRDIDYTSGNIGKIGALKNRGSDRYVPVPPPLMEQLQARRGHPDALLICTEKGTPLPYATYRRELLHMMILCGLAEYIGPEEQPPSPDEIVPAACSGR